MQAETIEQHLRRYGWVFDRAEVSGVWQTGFHGTERVFPMRIELHDTFLSFIVTSLLEGDVCWEEWPDLMADLLALNAEIKMSRLGLDPSGGICMSLQIPVSGMTYEGLETSLSVFAFNVEQCYQLVLNRVRDLGCYRDRQPLL